MARAPSTNPSWALLGELWDRFDADPAWIPAETEAITDAIHRELGLEDDPELRELTYRSTEAVIRLGLQLVHTSTAPDAAKSPPAAVEYARELVHRGIPVDALLRAHQIGHRVFYERFAARVRAELPTPGQLANALEQAAMWTHALLAGQSRSLVAIYTEEREQWARSAGAWRAEVVRAILAGQPAGPEAEQRLGHTLAGHHLGFVIWSPAEQTAALDQAAIRFASQLADSRPLLYPLSAGTIAGWVGSARPIGHAQAASIEARFLAAVGTDRTGIAGFAETHREALAARRVAELADAVPGSVTAYSDVALESLAVADRARAETFVTSELGPLHSADESWQRLAATLRCYLEHNARIRPTAQALGVHDNTIKNRIQAAAGALGRPVESRAAELLVALRLSPLLRARDRPPH